MSSPSRAFRADALKAPPGFRGFRADDGRPLDLEIGCGVGWHPIRYAIEHPERRLVAIEHTRTRFAAFERRIASHRRGGKELANLEPVQARAEAWAVHALPPACVDRIFLLYPNPYPKDADLNKRWHAMPFMGFLLTRLRPGGHLELRTNEIAYFEEARRFFSTEWGTRELVAESWRGSNGRAAETHFERKYLESGQACHRLLVEWPGKTA